MRLPPDIRKVHRGRRLGEPPGVWWDRRKRDLAAQRPDGVAQPGYGTDACPAHDRRLGGVALGHEEPADAGRPQVLGDAQHPGDRAYRTVERQLADGHVPPHRGLRQLPGGGQDPQRNRQIEGRPDLARIRGRQVHGHAARRHVVSGVANGRTHALARLAHRRVRQADDRKCREAGGNVHLHVHRHCVQTDHRGAAHPGEHVEPPSRTRILVKRYKDV